MNQNLCIYSPLLGARSESFIRRHIQDLLPNKTAVITNHIYGPEEAGSWPFDGPTYCLGKPQLYDRLKWLVQDQLGLKPFNQRIGSVKKFLRSNRVEVMMGQYLDQSLPLLELAQHLGIRVFCHAHGYDVSEKLRSDYWRKEYLKYNQFDGIITVSETSRQRLIQLGIQSDKIHVVYSGVVVPTAQIDRSHPGEMIRCLAVGRMVAKKAPILLLDAFRRAAVRNPHIHLDYIGTGELFSAARQFIKAFKLEQRVTLHGGQLNETVLEYMKNADIFIQHSVIDQDSGDEEGLPVAILEAMGHTLPVVSTRHAGIPEAVVDGVTGFLVEEGNSAGMGECILKLAGDCSLRTAMGSTGWIRASELFSWDRERQQLLGVLGLSY